MNAHFVEMVSSSQMNSIRRINETNLDNNYKAFEKGVRNQANIVSSGKSETTLSIHEYNLKLQANAQLANLNNTNKVFNELKAGNVKFSKGVLRYQKNADADVKDEKDADEIKTGTGYYVVLNRQENSSLNQIKSHTNSLYERIKQAYNLGFRKEPGTLVNLVF
jgi:hypothetical protein